MKLTPHARLTAFSLLAMLVPAVPSLRAEPPGASPANPANPRDLLALTENQETRTIDAEGRDVSINGNHNTLTLRGECHALTVSGNDNTVEVETVTSISLPGNGNRVSWEKANGGEKPQVTDLGKGNGVSRKAAAR